MDKKYFFFDIDGTLTDIKTGIPVPSALETIKRIMDILWLLRQDVLIIRQKKQPRC